MSKLTIFMRLSVLLVACRLGVKANIFNVGSLRRKAAVGKQSFDFFDAQNAAAKQQREELAYSALDMALEWLGSLPSHVILNIIGAQ